MSREELIASTVAGCRIEVVLGDLTLEAVDATFAADGTAQDHHSGDIVFR